MEAFITGSRVYGTPTETSDVDLVVLMDQGTRDALIQEFGLPVRCGKLNIIALTDEVAMLAWKKAREVCIAASACGSIDRDYAVNVHKAWFKQYGVDLRDCSGSARPSQELLDEILVRKQLKAEGV